MECHAWKPKLTELRALQNANTAHLPISALKRRKRRKWAKMPKKNYLEKKRLFFFFRADSFAPIFSSIGAKLTKLRFSFFHDSHWIPACLKMTIPMSQNDHFWPRFQTAITFFLEGVSPWYLSGIKRASYVSSSASMGSKIEYISHKTPKMRFLHPDVKSDRKWPKVIGNVTKWPRTSNGHNFFSRRS